jgi:hypothetical protein
VRIISELTEPSATLASEEDRNYLFLYRSSGANGFARVQRINSRTATRWPQKIVKEYDGGTNAASISAAKKSMGRKNETVFGLT